jgi:hypothetical protein
MPITVKIDDPATIQLLARYRQFISQEDHVEGTLDQAAEGLILGCLDEHHRFNAWCQYQAAAEAEPPSTLPFLFLPLRLAQCG